jgi:DNA repair photolyase
MKILAAAKKHALSKGHLGCLGDVATINLARGCAGGCVFCYARCVSSAPGPGQLRLYAELAEQLRAELDRRRRPLPSYVLFSTASDPFLGGAQVQRLSRACLEILASRGIGVSLSTRGDIPEEVIDLLARQGPHVRVTVPLPSLDQDYARIWEPETLEPRKRLFLVQRLLKAGVQVDVRIDPVIPFVNDSTEGLRELLSAIAGLGLTQAQLSFIHLRPGVTDQLRAEAPLELAELLLGGFSLPPESVRITQPVKFLHLSAKQRAAVLRRIQRVARERGVRVSACHCQNPGLPARRCPVEPPELPVPRGEQLSLIDA